MAAVPHAKYTFDTEFFEVVGQQRFPAGDTAALSAKSRDPEVLRQQAYAEGHTAGLQEGQAQAQADLLRLQQHLQNTLLALQTSLEDRERVLIGNLLGLVQASLGHILGHAAQHYGAEILEHHLRALLALARTDEALTLRIHPQARGYHEKLGLPQANIMGLALRVVPDTTLGSVDAVVEWQHGGIEARFADHAASLEKLLTTAGAATVPTPNLNLAATVPTATPTPGAGPAASTVASARADRAAALLGDDDLIDALK
jgi:flagellar biosynthesis/type III secretory pathway protein FliH